MGSLGIKATFLGSAFGSWDWGLDSSPGPLPSYKMNFKEHFGVLKILSKLRTFLVKAQTAEERARVLRSSTPGTTVAVLHLLCGLLYPYLVFVFF